MISEPVASPAFDRGLLTPVAVGHDGLVSDEAVLAALVRAELGLVRAWSLLGAVQVETADAIATAWGMDAGTDAERDGAANGDTAGAEVGHPGPDAAPWGAGSLAIDVAGLAAAAVDGGNPVIPLVSRLKQAVPPADRTWVHRGATSQDILDTAIMLVSRQAVDAVLSELGTAEASLSAFAAEHRDVVAVGRTLAQHAVPTTVGLRATVWLTGIRRARTRLRQLTLPVQLGAAAGTRASFLALGGPGATELPARYAETLGLDDAGAVWHTSRWPVTELADALTQTTDALGKLAGDVITLTRTEIAELSAGVGGGSSAMPQKSNPVAAVLIRAAALRAPQLAATMHLCATLAEDERPAGAWHAEWPTLRELLRLTLAASAHAAQLTAALRVDRDAAARNLDLTRGLILSERLSIVLAPLIGAERVATLVAEAASGADLAALVAALPEAADINIPALLDPANYTGDATATVDSATAGERPSAPHPTDEARS
ncbi:lyase family protein [Herbiconiux daphne]|uniref:Lyase family protein n=1 Tax=Herbiconiux daphne TaxID=2970914 RepID=A0ABT2H6Z3_9MICO|nr:lyase family protein [Herbiconiux daphne]MCS5735712.1 lyase family protein [Herbiconiux daphne]